MVFSHGNLDFFQRLLYFIVLLFDNGKYVSGDYFEPGRILDWDKSNFFLSPSVEKS